MPSAIPDHVDRLIALMEGTYTDGELYIPTGRFQHVEALGEYLLPNTAQAPYPFNIQDQGEFQPLDVPSSLSPLDRWHGVRLNILVVYARAFHDETERQKIIQKDRYQIRRVIGEPDNWCNVTGFSNVRILDDQGPAPEVVAGTEEDMDVIYILTVPIELIYREDHSS